jgi:hypothetical protein
MLRAKVRRRRLLSRAGCIQSIMRHRTALDQGPHPNPLPDYRERGGKRWGSYGIMKEMVPNAAIPRWRSIWLPRAALVVGLVSGPLAIGIFWLMLYIIHLLGIYGWIYDHIWGYWPAVVLYGVTVLSLMPNGLVVVDSLCGIAPRCTLWLALCGIVATLLWLYFLTHLPQLAPVDQ